MRASGLTLHFRHRFHEINIIQRRTLQGGASYNAGASFPLPGMSLPYPVMSLPYPVMSLPYNSVMSLSPNMAPTSSHEDLHPSTDATGNCVSRGSTAGTQIHVQLDVDSLSEGSSFLNNLAQSIVSFGEAHFSLCQKSSYKRRLLEPVVPQDPYNATVTGLDVTASSDNSHGKTVGSGENHAAPLYSVLMC